MVTWPMEMCGCHINRVSVFDGNIVVHSLVPSDMFVGERLRYEREGRGDIWGE